MSDAKNAAKIFAESISELATANIADALAKTEKQCTDLIASVEEKIGQIKTGYLAVKINDLEIKKLSKRMSPVLPRLLVHAKIGRNSLMVGPAGSGKTTIAHQVAEALGVEFGHINLTAGASETWLFGRQTPNGFVEGSFSKIYRNGGVFLLDEIDAADSNLLLSINTALDNGHMYNPMSGENLTRHKDFVCIAAANTNGKGSNHVYTGRSRLDASTLSRFIALAIDYDHELEESLCSKTEYKKFLFATRLALKNAQFDEFISTRDFINAELLANADVSYQDIYDSLVFNWSDAAKELAKKEFAKSDFKKPEIKPVKQLGGTVPTNAKIIEPEINPYEKRGRGRPTGWRKYKEPEKANTDQELQDEIARLRAENAKLNAPPPKPKSDALKADNQDMYERFNRGQL